MSADPWLIIRTPTGVHCWPLPATGHDAAILAARVAAGFPADDAWAGGGWDLQVTYGEPHRQVLRHATVHETSELGRVDTAAHAAAHAAALEQARTACRRADAKASWDALPEDVKAEVLASRTSPAPVPVKGRA